MVAGRVGEAGSQEMAKNFNLMVIGFTEMGKTEYGEF